MNTTGSSSPRKQPSATDRLTSISIMAVLVLISVWIGGDAVRAHQLAHNSLSWSYVDANFTSITPNVKFNFGENIMSWLAEARSHVQVNYTYTVNNHGYKGNSLSFEKAVEKEIAENYKMDLPTRVYYNPDQKDQSVLNPGADDIVFFSIVCMTGFLTVACSVQILLTIASWIGVSMQKDDDEESPNKPKKKKKKTKK